MTRNGLFSLTENPKPGMGRMLRVQCVHRLGPFRGRGAGHIGVGQGCTDRRRLRGRGVRSTRASSRRQYQRAA